MLQCVGANKICLEREDARLQAMAIRKAKGLGWSLYSKSSSRKKSVEDFFKGDRRVSVGRGCGGSKPCLFLRQERRICQLLEDGKLE